MSEIQSRATHRIDRREFIHTVAAGAGAAALSGCGADAQRATDDASQATRPWVKDPDPFIQHPTNLETRLESLHGFLTPNRLFFVRNHAPTPRVDTATYRLRIEGDAIEHPIALTYDDLLNRVVYGTPEAVVDRINWYREELGITGVSLDVNPGGQLLYEQVVESIRLLSDEVIPQFK